MASVWGLLEGLGAAAAAPVARLGVVGMPPISEGAACGVCREQQVDRDRERQRQYHLYI